MSSADPATAASLSGSNGFATEGDFVRLLCTATAGNPEPVLKILRDGVEVESGPPPSVAHEFTVRASDDGAMFVCDATSDVGAATDSLTFVVKCML